MTRAYVHNRERIQALALAAVAQLEADTTLSIAAAAAEGGISPRSLPTARASRRRRTVRARSGAGAGDRYTTRTSCRRAGAVPRPRRAVDRLRAVLADQEQDAMTKLSLISTQTAVTYSFRAAPGEFGWACCTVNDATGELLITSDWGNWSHRWSADPRNLGAPTLTAFIGGRGDVDYLARKLQLEGRAGQRFSAEKTAAALRRQLCERRLEDGREQLEGRLEPLPYLTREIARRIWDELGELADEVGCSSDLFYERIDRIEGLADYVTDEPWNYAMTEQTPEDRALRDVVLPALIEACRARAAAGATAP